MGLAIAACVRGYKCIFTTTDKQSKEKIDILRALGAEVIVCPTNVTSADPKFITWSLKINQKLFLILFG